MTVQQILESEPRFRRLKNIVNRYGVDGAATFYGVTIDEIKELLSKKNERKAVKTDPEA
jgi:hypothetical protein